MAFLRCRKGSRFWHACFYVAGAAGALKLVTRSTKVEIAPAGGVSEKEAAWLLHGGMDAEQVKALRESGMSAAEARKLAQKVADTWEAAAKKGWTVSHIRRVMGDLSVEVSGEEMEAPSVRAWFDDFVAGLGRKGKSMATVRNYRNAVARFKEFLSDRVDWSLERLTPRLMNDYMLELSGMFAVKTVRKEYGMVCAVLNGAVKLGVLDRNPGQGVELPQESRRDAGRAARRGFTVDELKLLLDRCDDEWRRMVLCALYLGGQRLGDVAMLRWDAVDWEKGVVSFVTQKTGREMVVPMIPALEAVLRAGKDAYGDREVFVHPSCATMYERSGSGRLSAVFSGLLFDAGLIDRDPRLAGKRYKKLSPARDGKRRVKNELSFHSLRYTVTTMLHDAGVVPAMVQEIVGHASPQVHAGYIKFGAEATERALEKLPEL